MGRFISEDPVKDGNNWHIYALNNPLKYIDPTGLVNIESDSVVGNTSYDTDTGSLTSTDADEDEVKSKTSTPKKKELTEEEKLRQLISLVESNIERMQDALGEVSNMHEAIQQGRLLESSKDFLLD